jgi:diacylglycerol kinase family enzyme
MSIAIIINPISGAGRRDAGRSRAELATAALSATREAGEVFVSERKGHARELAAGAVARGARLVVAWGGDGTVNEIASSIVGTPTALGIVPSGSGNGLARALGVGRDPARAIAAAVNAAPRQIDAGEIGGRLFFSIAGVGFDAHIASCFDRDTGGRGFSGYVRLSARELFSYEAATYRLGGAESPPRRALLITLANASQFGNGARIAPDARVDDGVLDLVVFEEVSRIATIVGLRRLFTGTIARQRGVSIQQVASAAIDTDRPMIFHVDGEPVQGGVHLDARVLPGALRVCVD